MTHRSKTFLCRYPFKGHWYGFKIEADNLADAEARMVAIARHTQIDGEVFTTVYGWMPSAIADIIAWFYSWRSGRA